MDVIYHRNCLDGVYSAHLFYLLSKIIKEEQLKQFTDHLQQKMNKKQQLQQNEEQYQKLVDLTQNILQFTSQCDKQQPELTLLQKNIINQEFFHTSSTGISYSTYSLSAGEFIPLKFPNKNKILFILDTCLINYNNIKTISEKYQYVVLIDHHTSFQTVKKDILLYKNKMKKLFYCYSQKYSAAELSLKFLEKYFLFEKRFQDKFINDLKTIIQYVGINDLKINQNKQSKSFTLGFYYFQIQLSHMNSLLNKRLGLINLPYLLQKGANLYKMHLKQIQNQISSAMLCQLNISGQIKNIKFYILRPANPGKISDIGIVLSYLSKIHGYENLTVLYNPRPDEIRVSTRSYRNLDNPLALNIAEKFQGGGHVCAAGFKIAKNKFNSQFIRHSVGDKSKLVLKVQEIQKILFQNGEK